MLSSPFDFSSSLRVGTVIFVSPDEIKVQLEIDAPDSVALNAITPRAFPRINSYLLIPSDTGYLVGQVDWITIENSQYPKRKGLQDFGLVDLPFPMRKLSLAPLGILHKKDNNDFEFHRGIESFPTVGDTVLFPTNEQMHAIITSGKNLRVKIGTSPLAGNVDVKIDPDRLFGRHVAVLGNTGSGKSCTVAGLIRWSIEAAKQQIAQDLNSRFIVLDPNGEYLHAFEDLNAKIYSVSAKNSDQKLQIPLWFFNAEEWCALTKATDKTQKPTLLQALRNVRNGDVADRNSQEHEMKGFLRTLISMVKIEKSSGSPWGGFPKSKSFIERLQKWENGGLIIYDDFSDVQKEKLHDLKTFISSLVTPRMVQYAQTDLTKNDVDTLLSKLHEVHCAFGGNDTDFLPIDTDIPIPFSGENLLRSVEANAELLNVSDYVETMIMRIRTILSDTKLKNVINDGDTISLDMWLDQYIGNSKSNHITIIDLSLLPAELIHIITAIIARMTFEALQRYHRLNVSHKALPTVLVMEEAHTFVKRYRDDAENQDASMMCCKVFEKIAREGRKFGLGLVLSSQRPSELSPTVLSQCNTFLLHRISNDKDQELVHRLLPDNLRGLLRDLPTLPAKDAILLGWASELPVLVRMHDLPQNQRPQSDDPDFWDVWIRKSERNVNWKDISDDWQERQRVLSDDDDVEIPFDSWCDEKDPNRQ